VNILVIDDEISLRRTIRMALESSGHRVTEAGMQVQALLQIAQTRPDLIFLDLKLGRESGLDVIQALLKQSPGLAIVVITAFASVETAVEAMRRGALDYLPKPFTPAQLSETVQRWGSRANEGSADAAVIESREPACNEFWRQYSRSPGAMPRSCCGGESGTGKGVLAREIHARSKRSPKPFVTVHCPSLSAELLESDLFGHAKGAFTGAIKETAGKVAAAEGGYAVPRRSR